MDCLVRGIYASPAYNGPHASGLDIPAISNSSQAYFVNILIRLVGSKDS